MKVIKRIAVGILLLGFIATTATFITSCTGGKVCQAKKTNNHR